MNTSWIISTFLMSFFLLSALKTEEVKSLNSYFKASPSIKLKRFASAKAKLKGGDVDLLELWESMLTGRSAPLAKWMKERYHILGLNHLFTPSGFHLSAVLSPILRFFKSSWIHLSLLSVIGLYLCIFIPGQDALKRMVLIKGAQKSINIKTGFIFALLKIGRAHV